MAGQNGAYCFKYVSIWTVSFDATLSVAMSRWAGRSIWPEPAPEGFYQGIAFAKKCNCIFWL